MTAPTIMIDGRPFDGRPPSRLERTIHRWHADWPPRYVVSLPCETGWNACELCGREHRIWLTDDMHWVLELPEWMRGLRLCVGCFRKHARRYHR